MQVLVVIFIPALIAFFALQILKRGQLFLSITLFCLAFLVGHELVAGLPPGTARWDLEPFYFDLSPWLAKLRG